MAGWVRWLLVLPAAWLSWVVALLTGLGFHWIAEAFCPPAQMISDLCVAPWFDVVERAIICGGAGLAAILITVSCTLIAPSHRRVVVAVTLVAGCAVAAWMAFQLDAHLELGAVVVAGLATAWWLQRHGWLGETRAEERGRQGRSPQ